MAFENYNFLDGYGYGVDDPGRERGRRRPLPIPGPGRSDDLVPPDWFNAGKTPGGWDRWLPPDQRPNPQPAPPPPPPPPNNPRGFGPGNDAFSGYSFNPFPSPQGPAPLAGPMGGGRMKRSGSLWPDFGGPEWPY